MSLLEIPITSLADSTSTVILDSISYDIRLQWNGRDESWYVYIGRTNQEFLFKTKVTNGSDFLRKYRSYATCPQGVMLVLDKEKLYGRLSRDSFSSSRFSLLYYTADTVDDLRRLKLIG